jgi:hypothetical protein
VSTSTSAAGSATERAQMGKRLAWAGVVAAQRLQNGQTGLYL